MLKTRCAPAVKCRMCAPAVKCRMTRRGFLRLEWAVSCGLVALALAWAGLRHLPLGAPWHAGARDLAAGAAAGALLWLCIPLIRLSRRMREVWDGVLVPFSRMLTTADIVVVALLSGISEELFFRGILLPEIGLAASSLLFGALHALNAVYATWAALTGAGFGLLALATGSLAAPMAAHATYNLGALLILRRSHGPAAGPGAQATSPQTASAQAASSRPALSSARRNGSAAPAATQTR